MAAMEANGSHGHRGAASADGADDQLASLQQLNGVWIKDKAASDSMYAACDLMELGWLMREAVGLVRGLQLRVTGETFELDLLPVTGLGWFKIRERYPLTGEPVQCGRRDMRRGHHTGRVGRSPTGSGLLLRAEWQDPCGGIFEDSIYVASPGVLHIDTTMEVHGKRIKYCTVYRK